SLKPLMGPKGRSDGHQPRSERSSPSLRPSSDRNMTVVVPYGDYGGGTRSTGLGDDGGIDGQIEWDGRFFPPPRYAERADARGVRGGDGTGRDAVLVPCPEP